MWMVKIVSLPVDKTLWTFSPSFGGSGKNDTKFIFQELQWNTLLGY
jgi:hypothetical protein